MRVLTGRRVLVLGANGFIGNWVSSAVVRAGASVVAAVRPKGQWQQPSGDQTTVVSVDVEQIRMVDLIRDARPSVVINAVGYGVDRDERNAGLEQRLNAQLPEEIGAALLACEPELPANPGVRLVHFGSAFEHGSVEGPVTEDSPCRPNSSYGESKLEGTTRLERLRQHDGLRAVTLRIATVYGAGEHPHRLLPSLLRARTTGEAVRLSAGGQARDFTWVGDIAEGVVRVLIAPVPPFGITNLATGTLTTVRDFATMAARVIGLTDNQLQFGVEPYRANEVWQGPIQTERSDRWLGWRPATTVEQGVRLTAVPAPEEVGS